MRAWIVPAVFAVFVILVPLAGFIYFHSIEFFWGFTAAALAYTVAMRLYFGFNFGDGDFSEGSREAMRKRMFDALRDRPEYKEPANLFERQLRD